MNFLQKIRLRVFAVLVALTFGVIGVVGLFSVPVLPAIGVALVAAFSMVNTMTAKLSAVTCSGCGSDLSNASTTTYGIICSKCGTTTLPYNNNEPNETMYAFEEDDESQSTA